MAQPARNDEPDSEPAASTKVRALKPQVVSPSGPTPPRSKPKGNDPIPPGPRPGWAARNERRKFVASIFWGLAAAIAGFAVVRPAFEDGLSSLKLASTGLAVLLFAVLCLAAYIVLGGMEDK